MQHRFLVFILIFCQTVRLISSHHNETGYERLGLSCDQAAYDSTAGPFWEDYSRGRIGSGGNQGWADATDGCFSGELIACIGGTCQCMKAPYETVEVNKTCLVPLGKKCNGPSPQVFPCEGDHRCDTAEGKCLKSESMSLFCRFSLVLILTSSVLF